MLNLITSYLIQSGECVLPGIGSFTLLSTPSTLDVANKVLIPPGKEYRFSDNYSQADEGLINYIAYKKEMETKSVTEEFRRFCHLLKERILSGEKIQLKSIGVLENDGNGGVHFEPYAVSILEAVPAIRAVHKEAKHSMIVGDKETDSSEMSEILQVFTREKSGNLFWKIAAIVLVLLAAGILFYHFYYSPSGNPFGNSNKVMPQPTPKTYSTP